MSKLLDTAEPPGTAPLGVSASVAAPMAACAIKSAAAAQVTVQQVQHYTTLPYIDGVFDCADFVAQVQLEVFGRVLALPPHGARPAGTAGQRAMLAKLSDQLATRLDAPQVGAVVLLSQLDAQGLLAWHMGTLFEQHGQWWVLHNVRAAAGVQFQRLTALQGQACKVEGYYTCA